MPSSPASSQPKTARSARFSKRTIFGLLFAGLLFTGFGGFVAMRRSHGTRSQYQRLPAAVYYHRVKRGMTQEAVERSCGRPEYVEQVSSLGDEGEAWFYSASDGQIQIDFDNGKVQKINRE